MGSLVFPIIGLCFIVATLVMFYKLKQSVAPDRLSDATTVQDFIGIEDIRDGVICLARPNGSSEAEYRAVIEVTPINYELFSDREQNTVEDAFAGFLASLSFPVQFYIQTRLLEMHDRIDHLRRLASGLEGALRDYAEGLADHLENLMALRSIMVKKTYVIIPAKADDFAEAKVELERRADIVIAGLARCGLQSRRLGSAEVAEMLYIFFNKERAPYARFDHVERQGFLALYVTGERGERRVEAAADAARERKQRGAAAGRAAS